jgi:diguanylate cyclase (GGDEF)-like protein
MVSDRDLAADSGQKPWIVMLASGGALLMSAAVLLTWTLHSVGMGMDLAAVRNMKIDTAALLGLVGAALWIFCYPPAPWRNFAVRMCGIWISMVATVTIAQFAFGYVNDSLTEVGEMPLGLSGRMALLTAVSFDLVGAALFWLPSNSLMARRAAQCLLLTTLLISLFVVVGFFYGSEVVNKLEGRGSTALHTALTFMLLSVGMLYARNDFELTAPIRSNRIGGLLAKTSLPGLTAVPILFGWLLLKGEQMEFYGFASGVAVYVVVTVAVLGRIVWYSAQTLNDVDRQHQEAREREHEARLLSSLDPLTGVINRRALRDRFEREWNRSIRIAKPLSFLMLDVDFFKRINDVHGHVVGDSVLKGVAFILEQECRSCDVVARYGGEEFCVIVPDADEAGVALLAERIRVSLEAHRIDIAGQVVAVTASLGVAEFRGRFDDPQALIDRADQALLAAKRQGRNRVVRSSSLENSAPTAPSTSEACALA